MSSIEIWSWLFAFPDCHCSRRSRTNASINGGQGVISPRKASSELDALYGLRWAVPRGITIDSPALRVFVTPATCDRRRARDHLEALFAVGVNVRLVIPGIGRQHTFPDESGAVVVGGSLNDRVLAPARGAEAIARPEHRRDIIITQPPRRELPRKALRRK